MAAIVGSLVVSLTADSNPLASAMARAESTVTRGAAKIGRSAGVAERSVSSFFGSAGQRSFSPYAMLAVSRGFENAADRAGLLRASVLSVTGAMGGLVTALSSNVLLRYADAYVNLSNQIRVVSTDSADAAARFKALADVSERSRSGLEATSLLYSRIQKAAPDRSAEDILGYVETMQKALALGGATIQEARSAAIQLSQAIASNRLGGEELRAILETPLALELAKGLGVTIGKLREMGIAGELTATKVFEGLDKAKKSVDQQFAKSIKTVDQSLTILDNKFTAYIGKVNEAYGATGAISKAISGFGDNLDRIIPIAASVAAALGAIALARNKALLGGLGGAAAGAYLGNELGGIYGALAGGAIGGLGGAKSFGIVEQIKTERAATKDALSGWRADVENLISERKRLEGELVEAGAKRHAAMSTVRTSSAPAGASDDLLLKQMAAEEKVAGLVQKRTEAEQRLISARAGAVTSASAEVDRAREALRTDQQRISVIQQRIVAEERAAAVAARAVVGDRSNDVSATGAKILGIDQKIADERAAIAERAQKQYAARQSKLDQSVSSARIALAEKEARLVEARMRQTAARSTLSDLRSQQSLPGFDQAFGTEYERALKQQGKALNDAEKLTKDVTSAREALTAAEAKAGAGVSSASTQTKALNSLLKSREAATASLAAQQQALTESQQRLATVESGQLSSSKMTKLLEQESKAVEAYRGRIGDLQKATTDLQSAQKQSVQTPEMVKAAGNLASVEAQLKKAQAGYAGLSDAVAKANANIDQSGRVAALRQFQKANTDLVAIQRSLIQVGAEMENAAKSSENLSRSLTTTGQAKAFFLRQGNAIVSLFGGPWGVALTGGILLLGYLGVRAQKAAQDIAKATSIINEELDKLGKGSDTGRASTSKRFFEIEAQAERLKIVQERIRQLDDEFKKAVSNIAVKDIAPVPGSILTQTQAVKDIRKSLRDLYDDLQRGSITQQQFNSGLGEIAKANPGLAALVARFKEVGATADAGRDAVKAITTALDELRNKSQDPVGVSIRVGVAKLAKDFGEGQEAGKKAILEEVQAVKDQIEVEKMRAAGRNAEADTLKKIIELRKEEKFASGKDSGSEKLTASNKELETWKKRTEEFKKAENAAASLREKLARLDEESQGAFLGDLDRQVVEHARQMKATAAELAAYVEAAKTGDFSKISGNVAKIRDIELLKSAGSASRDLIKEYGTLSQIAPLLAEKQMVLNKAVEAGAITSAQAKLAMADYLATFGKYQWINQTSDAFGQFIHDAVDGTTSLTDAIGNLRKSLQKLLIEELAAKPFKDLIRSMLSSGATSGGGGLTGFLSGIFGGSGSGTIGGTGGGLGGLYDSGGIAGVKAFGPKTRLGRVSIADSGLGSSHFPAILKKGETVLTENMSARTASTLAGLSAMAANSNGGGPRVIVNNYTDTPVQESNVKQTGNGIEIDLKKIVIGTVTSDIASSNGEIGRTMEAAYGVRRK